MIIDTINTSCSKNTLIIGRQLENNYRQIVFNCADYGVEVDSITLVHQRQGDLAPYIVTTSNTDTLTWTVSDTDTSYDGYGQAELRINFTNGLCKSVVYTTYVIKSITADATIPSQLQSWYDAMIDYIDEHSVSPEQIEEAVAEYLDEHPVQAPVQSVNGQQGDVVLSASDVGALPSSTVIPTRTSQLTNDSGFLTAETDPVFTASPAHSITNADITAWNNKSDFSGNYNDLTNKPTIPTKTSQLQNDSGFLSSAVTSFNGQSGAVTYNAPVSSVDGKTGAVSVLPSGGASGQILSKRSGSNYDVQWINAPSGGGAVDSVNGQTGTVVLDAEDVGALPDTTVIPTKTSDLTNDSGFLTSAVTSFNGNTGAVTYTAPVTSVNGATGAVTVTVPTKTSDLQNDSGFLTSAPVSSVDGKTGAVNVIPTGGTSGQVLSKASGTNYDVEWTTPQGGGGGSEWTLVNSVTLSEATNTITIDKDTNGNSFALKDVLVVYWKDRANAEGVNSAGKIKLVGQWGTKTYSFTKLNGGTFDDRLNEVTLKREYYSSKGNSIITCGAFNAGNSYDYSASFIGSELGMYPAIRIELTNDNNSVTFPVSTIVEVYTK